MHFYLRIGLVLLILFGCQSQPTHSDYQEGGADQGFLPPPVWNATMQNLKQDMISIQHFIFDQQQFESPDNQSFLKKQIHKLSEESKSIKHDPVTFTKDPTLRFVARQFSDEIQSAEQNFNAGWLEYSRGQLIKVTSYCLECHTRMRDGASFNPENSNRDYLTRLPVASRIEFMIAFRQFEPAYNLALENLKLDLKDTKIEIDSNRIARLGLLVATQYLQDQEKTEKIIQTIEKNSTLPEYLRKANRTWKKSLANWDINATLNSLPDVRAFNSRRLSEVDDMVTIPALLRLLSTPLNREELGESLYLAGQSYENLQRFSFISLHENYYESCVRQSSHTKWGALCYKKLSDSIYEGYSGSSGTHIPAEIKLKLINLKKVIEEKK